jgi:phosphodiesterase/alkaline phosphatase D-like protein
MRRSRLLIAGLLVLGALAPAVALAASSPTVATGSVTNVTTGSAVLTGTVNPNGASTGYSFRYGTSSALGAQTASKQAGAGTKPAAATELLGGLSPGTTYSYQLVALSSTGSAVGKIRTFTTQGQAPPGAVTGTATSVGPTTATVNGTIETNGAATTWQVEYGTVSGAFTSQTPMQTVANSASPVPVAAALTGLSPLTEFYDRIVAYHGPNVIGAGAEGSFFTPPSKKLAPNLQTKTTPKRDTKAPFKFTTHASLTGNAGVPASLRCAGNATVNYYSGKILAAHALVPVLPNCTFSAHVSFRLTHGQGLVPITVKVHYVGNGYLAGATKVSHVKVGHN